MNCLKLDKASQSGLRYLLSFTVQNILTDQNNHIIYLQDIS